MPDLISTLGTALDVAMVVCAFTAIIVVHELGHFIAARWAGIRVLAFAVGFGPAVFSFRKGLGVRRGSSEAEYKRLTEGGKAAAGFTSKGTAISPTEYRLNALPFGGYVKMLGQDDSDPGAVSDDPDSYQRCKPWKRMVVISAGVVMNVLMAAVLFIIVFNVGLKTEPAKVGSVEPNSPAAKAVALNAAALGVKDPGLASGDVLLSVNGRKPNSFNDLVFESLMAHRGSSLSILVQRKGFAQPLEFSIIPEVNPETRLQMIGVLPSFSARLEEAKTPRQRETFVKNVTSFGFPELRSGMRLVRVNGAAVESAHELNAAIEASNGANVKAEFAGDDGASATILLQPHPVLQVWTTGDGKQEPMAAFEHLLGIVPVLTVKSLEGAGEKSGLKPGDIFARLGSREWPGYSDGVAEIKAHKGSLFRDGAVRVIVVRTGSDGKPHDVDLGEVPVDRNGRIGFGIAHGAESPARISAWPRKDGSTAESVPPRPSGSLLGLLPGSVIRSVESESVRDMGDLRGALRRATRDAFQSHAEQATVRLSVELPVAGDSAASPAHPLETVEWKFGRAEIESLHKLAWQSPLPAGIFQPESILLRAEGPGGAIAMGLRETHRVMMSTYLTFVRLFQGTVKVEHLKGPVGIAHAGTLIAERGFIWLLFFMALISVNLAVFNFLPLPIVDGGHFVYLLYEQITGRPVSPAVQNAAAMVGVILLACLFLVVTYNDIVNLFG